MQPIKNLLDQRQYQYDTGCEHCYHGLINPPNYAIVNHSSMRMIRLMQFVEGLLQFCHHCETGKRRHTAMINDYERAQKGDKMFTLGPGEFAQIQAAVRRQAAGMEPLQDIWTRYDD